ncbi:C-type lectin domain family 4 member E-like isoform X1 [Poecilia reticulata]|uniref:C-type lectin domain family 4 member E-like isoform X1 n=1 Tax=Poecilia reticulata TaxID=8081 RepID=UPI0007E956DB|nr:PREDICTED: C-type lectin domain family 4 member E-like isoform X1 [Poecilia reticulata]
MKRPQADEDGQRMSVVMNQQEGDEEAAVRGENPSRTSKLPAGGVVLLVLVGLLAAALIVIYRLSTHIVRTNEDLQRITEENKVLSRNLSAFEDEPSCETGWVQFQGSCYHFSTDQFSWAESRRSCREAGAELVKVDSRELQVRNSVRYSIQILDQDKPGRVLTSPLQYFLRFHLTGKMKSFQDMFWIGLTDSAEEGRWVWTDGSDLSESVRFWSQKEPDNWTAENPAGENCVRMGTEGGGPMNNWYDKDCGAAQKRICQKRNFR